MRLMLTPIREVTECASIPHLPECYAGSTQWFPALHRPTGNYWEPERERARGVRVSGRVCAPDAYFFHVIYGKHRVGLHAGSSASAVSYHTPSSKTHTDTHPLAV